MSAQSSSMEIDRAGRGSALAVWVLYLLSIPSLAVFALVGLVWAYMARGGASSLAESHFDDQIRIWWIAFAWAVGLGLLSVVAWALTVVLIGFPLLWIIGLAGLIVAIWFTLRSVFGLLRLLNDRPV